MSGMTAGRGGSTPGGNDWLNCPSFLLSPRWLGWVEGFQYFRYFSVKFWQAGGHYIPDQVQVDSEIFVNEFVSHSRNLLHGMEGWEAVKEADVCLTAAPMISRLRTTAS